MMIKKYMFLYDVLNDYSLSVTDEEVNEKRYHWREIVKPEINTTMLIGRHKKTGEIHYVKSANPGLEGHYL